MPKVKPDIRSLGLSDEELNKMLFAEVSGHNDYGLLKAASGIFLQMAKGSKVMDPDNNVVNGGIPDGHPATEKLSAAYVMSAMRLQVLAARAAGLKAETLDDLRLEHEFSEEVAAKMKKQMGI